MVSVVIPTYNRHDSLLKSVNSVINQSFRNFEVIVVNDNPLDFDVKICIDNLNDNRCSVFFNKFKKGANGARNYGIHKSTGTYIAFLDDDDIWLPNYLEEQIKMITKNKDYNAIFSGYQKRNYDGNVIEKFFKQSSIDIPNLIKSNFGIGASSTLMVRSDLFDEIGLWNEKLQRFQDLELIIRILKTESLLHNPKILVQIPEGNQGFNLSKLYNSYFIFYFSTTKAIINLPFSEFLILNLYLIKKPISLIIKHFIKKINIKNRN